MTWCWTQSLREPLATVLSANQCLRVESDKKQGWHVLSPSKCGDGMRWSSLSEDMNSLKPLSVVQDKRLKQIPSVLGDWLGHGYEVRMIAHKPHRRAVFFLVTESGPAVAKIYHKDRALFRRWTAFPSGDLITTPTVFDWDEERRVLTTSLCSGRSLNDLWMNGDGVPEHGDALTRVARALWATPVPDGDFPEHTAFDEIRVLEERLPLFHQTLADPSPRAEALVQRVSEALASTSTTSKTLSHRDLHDKQILIDGDQTSLIDLDLAAIAHPALDVANMLGHIRLRALKGAALPWREIATRFVGGLEGHSMLQELNVWTAATLVRILLIYARRQRPETLLDDLIESASAALDRGGEWKGLL